MHKADSICGKDVALAVAGKNKEHNLIGDYSGYRECHLAPDWLLIYKQTDDELRLNRTGSHADLFGM